MSDEDEFQVRPGRIRSKSVQRHRRFIAQALAAARKAGLTTRRASGAGRRQGFGRGRRATIVANRLLSNHSRLAVIKARVVRHRRNPAPLRAHLRYLQREGVTRDGDKAVLFNKDVDAADRDAFAEKCSDDRHHFRFIVSPEDAYQMDELRGFTRNLMRQAEIDLETQLDWVGVTHWNTEHPHIHIIVRGRTDQNEDLVISRDYIREGFRARAQTLITEELGPRTEADIRLSLSRQIDAERFTQLDRQLLSEASRLGYVDVAPDGNALNREFQVLKAGRVRKLEALGLADQFAPGQWVISDNAEIVLREMSERGDIIKRLHRALTSNGVERKNEAYEVSARQSDAPIIGRLLGRGLDNELKGTAYAVIDGIDGQVHHLRLPSLEATSDAPVGAIVMGVNHRQTNLQAPKVTVLSDLDIAAQVTADGATWLDREALKEDHNHLALSGFGSEVRSAIVNRTTNLIAMELATEVDGNARFTPNLLQKLEHRELESVSKSLDATHTHPLRIPVEGEHIAGLYQRRLTLASGRFALLGDGNGFQLVPWSPQLDRHLGEAVSGTIGTHRSVSWDFKRSKTLGLEM